MRHCPCVSAFADIKHNYQAQAATAPQQECFGIARHVHLRNGDEQGITVSKPASLLARGAG